MTTLPADKFDANMQFAKPKTDTHARLEQLAPLPGFNTRVKDEEYEARVMALSVSMQRHGFYEHKPLAVVMLPDDETIYFYDGEHRYDAAAEAIAEGADLSKGIPISWAPDGVTVRDLTVSLVHGNEGERLSPVELAAVVTRLKAMGLEKDEIAVEIGKSPRHVDNLLVLAGANQTVKKAVAGGQIAAAEAVKLVRKDPKTAAKKITDAVKAAEAKGKAKATPKTMATGPKMKTERFDISLPEGETMGAVLKSMAKQIREHVKVDDKDVLTESGRVSISLTVIDHEAEAKKQAALDAKAEATNKAAAAKLAKATAAKKAADAKTKKAAAAKKTPAKKPAAAAKEAPAKPKAKTPAKAKTKPAAKKPAQTKAEPAPSKDAAKPAESAPETVSDENNGL